MAKLLKIKVLPRSAKNEIVGTMADGTLKVKLTAAPVDGAANEALLQLLSEEWNVPKSKIRIVRGRTSKNKLVEVMVCPSHPYSTDCSGRCARSLWEYR